MGTTALQVDDVIMWDQRRVRIVDINDHLVTMEVLRRDGKPDRRHFWKLVMASAVRAAMHKEASND